MGQVRSVPTSEPLSHTLQTVRPLPPVEAFEQPKLGLTTRPTAAFKVIRIRKRSPGFPVY